MDLTVLGGWGAWPPAGGACSGYLVRSGEQWSLIDPGYGTVPRLQERIAVDDLDAVLVTHGHPDHCADLNPLLRARVVRDQPPPAPPLAVYAPDGELAAVLALDRPGMLDAGIALHAFRPGDRLRVGRLDLRTCLLPHHRPNAALRLDDGSASLVYTGDGGPSDDLIDLANGADLLLAEASYVDTVPADTAGRLSSARDAGRAARDARVGRLVLTHLLPGTDATMSIAAARALFDGPVDVAVAGTTFEVPAGRRPA